MKEPKKYCCICGKEIVGWGNNPCGATDEDGNFIEWNDDDECCDECDEIYVLSGRMHQIGYPVKAIPVPNFKKGGK